MKTSGVFFLRGRPASVVLKSPADGRVKGWLLPLGERTEGGGVFTFTAHWRGPEADLFITQHPQLTAGHCLSLDLDRLRAQGDELHARVLRCRLAPPRWPAPDHSAAQDAVGASLVGVTPAAFIPHTPHAGH